MDIRRTLYGEGLTNLGLNEEKEKAEIAEYLSGTDTALLVEGVFSNVDSQLDQRLVEANVVLTLSGFKPSTDVFIPINNQSEIDNIKLEVEKLNTYFKKVNPDIRISTSGRISRKGNNTSMKVNSLLGFERLSKTSKLPGMITFDRSSGWEGWWEWYGKVVDGLEEAQEQGKLPKTPHILGGVIHGYPDQAILDSADSEQTDKEMEDTTIPNTGRYEEAEPSFLIYPEHKNNPDIQKYIEEAGKILEDFYNSEWHKKYEARNS
jgi:hypothetical protein